MYPEYRCRPEQKQAWLARPHGRDRRRRLARRFGWKVGDRVPLQGTIWQPDNRAPWEFNIVGIYDAGPGHRQDAVLLPLRLQTKTATEKVFASDFAKQVGDIGAIVTAIAAVVILFILFVAGNAMAQSIRERTNEIAILKTLGYTDGKVLGMVLLESTLVAAVGGALGLSLAWVLIAQGDPTGGLLPIFHLPPRDLAFGVALVAVLGLFTGLVPALQAGRLRIVDALRRS
jgi:putative ABC transport system permease protein